jgi:hypothetical protein
MSSDGGEAYAKGGGKGGKTFGRYDLDVFPIDI